LGYWDEGLGVYFSHKVHVLHKDVCPITGYESLFAVIIGSMHGAKLEANNPGGDSSGEYRESSPSSNDAIVFTVWLFDHRRLNATPLVVLSPEDSRGGKRHSRKRLVPPILLEGLEFSA
jgi:hypothetical protein